MSLVYVAKAGSFDDFLKEYTPADAAYVGAGGRPLLFQSIANKDVSARVAITTRLLDDGSDPSVVSGGINVLHVLFGQRAHDAELEAPMLRRLITGGADVNLVSKRWGPPMASLIQYGPSPEEKRVPFYDVLFEQPNLDFSLPYMKGTLRDLIFNSVWNLPILRERVLAYESKQPQA